MKLQRCFQSLLNQSLRVGLRRGKANSKQAPQLHIHTSHIIHCALLVSWIEISGFMNFGRNLSSREAFPGKLVLLTKKFPHCPYGRTRTISVIQDLLYKHACCSIYSIHLALLTVLVWTTASIASASNNITLPPS